jgi:hypothetical protein
VAQQVVSAAGGWNPAIRCFILEDQMIKYVRAILVLGFLVSGCAPQVAVKHLDSKHRLPSSGEVAIYKSPEAVGRAYKQIALLTIEDKRSLRRDESEDLTLLAQAAKTLGAEAVVVLGRRTMTRRTKDPSGGGDIVYHYPRIEAAAIVFEP